MVDRAQQAMLTPAEEAAFDAFYRKNWKKVWAVSVRRSAGERELADTVFQEVFVLVGRKWREVQGMKPARQQGWLFTSLGNIVRHEYAKQLTRLGRECPAGDDYDLESDPVARNDIGVRQRPVDDVVLDRVTYQQVLALAPKVLSEREFLVVVMTHIDGFPRVEIAGMLGERAGTIRSDLHRAMKKLREAPELRRLIEHFKEGRR